MFRLQRKTVRGRNPRRSFLPIAWRIATQNHWHWQQHRRGFRLLGVSHYCPHCYRKMGFLPPRQGRSPSYCRRESWSPSSWWQQTHVGNFSSNGPGSHRFDLRFCSTLSSRDMHAVSSSRAIAAIAGRPSGTFRLSCHQFTSCKRNGNHILAYVYKHLY